MQVNAIKTHKITQQDTNILEIVDKYLPQLPEKSIVAVSSKIVAICEGRIIRTTNVQKEELAQKEADMYLPKSSNKYGVLVSVKNGIFVASAGIDESNGNGYYVLWPKDPQQSVNKIREHLKVRFHLTCIGVILADSRNVPLRFGVTGIAVSHSGFAALNSYVGAPDIFGRKMHVEKVNVADTLAAAAVGEMGEGAEQTPLAVITDASFVHFQQRNPTDEELQHLQTNMEDDIFAGLLTAAKWIPKKV